MAMTEEYSLHMIEPVIIRGFNAEWYSEGGNRKHEVVWSWEIPSKEFKPFGTVDYYKTVAKMVNQATCECGEKFNPVALSTINCATWYQSNKGTLGACIYLPHIPGVYFPCRRTNCEGHRVVHLDDGKVWDLDGKSPSCSLQEDHEHYCWHVTGDLPNITVDGGLCTPDSGGGAHIIELDTFLHKTAYITDGVLYFARDELNITGGLLGPT
jgi:hypothetical protein